MEPSTTRTATCPLYTSRYYRQFREPCFTSLRFHMYMTVSSFSLQIKNKPYPWLQVEPTWPQGQPPSFMKSFHDSMMPVCDVHRNKEEKKTHCSCDKMFLR
jgi:hypothetical protein